MLAPKRSKYRKAHKGRVHGLAKGGTDLNFGAYGLRASDPGRITARQIEAARRAITRHIRRAGRVWIRIFPDVPVSQKPAEVRMGSGKGSPEFWICRVKPGRIMFELDGVPPPILPARRSISPPPNCRSPHASLPAEAKRSADMKTTDARAKTDDELTGELDVLGKEIFNLRFQRANGQLENTARVRQVRRDIARIKTLLGERRRAAPQGRM